MFRLYSKGCEYALRALLYLAPKNGRRHVAVGEICRQARIPEAFTRKVFQRLVQNGFLLAVPGPGGGYMLARPAKTISILSVIQAVDGPETFGACVMGLPQCSSRHACPLHESWSGVKERLIGALQASTLLDLMRVGGAAEAVRARRAIGREKR